MKVFISSDIEGTAGIAHREEGGEGDASPWFAYYKERMTAEVAAACEGALAAGAGEVLVKDAHYTARNIDPAALPRGARLSRGWSEDPWCMLAGAEGFDAVVMTGYHSPVHSPHNPLSHTMNDGVDRVVINGKAVGEFEIGAYTAGRLGIPLVFLSGDAGVCADAAAFLPAITTVATGEGLGDAMVGLHPLDAEEAIAKGVQKALAGDLARCRVDLPGRFEVEVTFKAHQQARRNSFYPGASQTGPCTLAFAADDYFEILRFFHFVL